MVASKISSIRRQMRRIQPGRKGKGIEMQSMMSERFFSKRILIYRKRFLMNVECLKLQLRRILNNRKKLLPKNLRVRA